MFVKLQSRIKSNTKIFNERDSSKIAQTALLFTENSKRIKEKNSKIIQLSKFINNSLATVFIRNVLKLNSINQFTISSLLIDKMFKLLP